MTRRFQGEILTSREETDEYLKNSLFRSKSFYEVPDELWERALYLWARYHSQTERFDRAACTGWKYGEAIPVNHEQRMMSYQNADRQRLLLERESGGIPLELFREANQAVLRWGLAEQEAFCKDYEWRRAMIIKCEKHGEVTAEPNTNGDVYCPQCIITEDITHKLHVDKAKPGTEMNGVTLVTADGAVLESIQSFTSTARDREKLLKAGKIYGLMRGPHFSIYAVQGHMPCQSPCEPGQRAEEAETMTLHPERKGTVICEKHGESGVAPIKKMNPKTSKPEPYCLKCWNELQERCRGLEGPSQYEMFLEGLKKADLIESYRMTGEDTAEIKMKYVVNWINKVGWSRLDQG